MCRSKNGDLLTNKDEVLARWKEHFEQHLNDGAERAQPPNEVDLADDGVQIDLPSREEIEGALKYLKNNKAAGSDSISAELLKNGGPNLVGALSSRPGPARLYRKTRPKGYCVQFLRKEKNSIVQTIEGSAC